MKTLYIISGPPGSGKTTVSRIIAKSKEKSVLLEGDEIYHHVVGGYKSAWEEGNHLDVFLNVSCKMIEEYLRSGYDVIFNYVLDEEKVRYIKNNIGFKDYSLKFVVLLASGDTLIKRDSKRQKENQMGERCLKVLKSFKEKNIDEKYILYTDKLSEKETVDAINDERFIY